MSDYAISLVWSGYAITTPSDPAVGGLGHAGAVVVEGDTGATRYFEYGRYARDDEGNLVGIVRSFKVSNLTITSDEIDKNSLRSMVVNLNGRAGANTPESGIIVSLLEGGYASAIEFAQSALNNPVATLGREYSWQMIITAILSQKPWPLLVVLGLIGKTAFG